MSNYNNYYNKLIENIKKNRSKKNLYYNIITPYSAYYLCDHFVVGNICRDHNLPPTKANNLLKNKNYDSIKEYDIVLCEGEKPNYKHFCDVIFPKIKTKIILITLCFRGNCPSRKRKGRSDMLLNSPKIHRWFTQNPIQDPAYNSIKKYIPFPYGINPSELNNYAISLIQQENKPVKKDKLLIHLHCGRTNRCRKILPIIQKICSTDFYISVKKTKYILSPIGDRHDCYRHWEAIGLGTIPVSNIHEKLKPLFNDNMYYVKNTQQMLDLLKNSTCLHEGYKVPNKDLICLEYWRNYININSKDK